MTEILDDLISLNPPTTENLLRVLHRRFKRDLVHTRLGSSSLLSLNPYRPLRHSVLDDEFGEPHPHQLLSEMKLRLTEGLENKQLFLPIGESGSGKSSCLLEAAKYLASEGNDKLGIISTIELLRALGNAKTARNDDASRFVMLLEVGFDFRGQIIGYNLQTYMLEKFLVTSRNSPNFHAFYALLSGADPHLLKSLRLSRSSDSYAILQPTPSNAHNGKEAFDMIRNCLSFHGLDEKLFSQILAAILKFGNVFFIPVTRMDGTAGVQLEPRSEFLDACSLLGVDSPSLESSLLAEQNSNSAGDCAKVGALRDMLLRALYSRLFMFITKKLTSGDPPQSHFITLLDTPGFQTLEKNSFNQLVINLTSEKTQEILLDNYLKEKQEEFIREGIKWVKVDTRGIGGSIFDAIEKNGPLCHSKTEAESIELILDTSPLASRLGNGIFRIRHFAGTVNYSKTDFPDKIDSLPKSMSNCMYGGSHPWMKDFFPEGSSTHSPGRPLSSLSHLYLFTHKLRSWSSSGSPTTNRHYFIHTIKPNELKQPNLFEAALVLHQLKYHRILDSLTVHRNGYSYSIEFDKFLERYKLLSLLTWPTWRGGSSREGVSLVLGDLVLPENEYFIGRTRVFLRDNVIVDLENYRQERLDDLTLLIQKTWRGWRDFQRWKKIKWAQRVVANAWKIYYHKKRTCVEQERNRKKIAIGKIQRAYLHWKRKQFLLHLSFIPLPMSPIIHEWPPVPSYLHQASYHIQALFHKWRCSVYRKRFVDSNERNRMGEKLTASNLMKGKKACYGRSVSHPFLGDYVRLRSNSEWRRIARQDTLLNTLVFADIVNKISRRSGRLTSYLLALSTHSLLVLDPRTLSLRERLPVLEITKLSLSPYCDNVLIFHRLRPDAFEGEDRPQPCSGCSLFDSTTARRGDLIISTDHVIELATKVYLVSKNAHSHGKGPAVEIREKIEANFGNGPTRINFIKTSPSSSTPGIGPNTNEPSGNFKIIMKQGKMDIYV